MKDNASKIVLRVDSSILHLASKVGAVLCALHFSMRPLDGPLSGDLDPVRKEFRGGVACDIHVSVLALGSVQAPEGKGLSWNGCRGTNAI
jgi:hypothetical protein